MLGATGQTGQHFVSMAVDEGHKVRAFARDPAKLRVTHPDLVVHRGSISDVTLLDDLLDGVDFVVSMLGDVKAQRERQINTELVRHLVPAMRRHGVSRFLYQSGGLTKPPGRRLSPIFWLIRNTLARGYIGQHQDNEAVVSYLVEEAGDIEWMVHRAGIGSDGPSKGELHRSERAFSIATFQDCARYNLRTVMDPSAVHTCDLSSYRKG